MMNEIYETGCAFSPIVDCTKNEFAGRVRFCLRIGEHFYETDPYENETLAREELRGAIETLESNLKTVKNQLGIKE